MRVRVREEGIMTVTWTYSAVIQEPGGDIREVTFNSKEELYKYIETCNKQVLFTRSNGEDTSYHKESTIF